MTRVLPITVLLLACLGLPAQQQNSLFASLNVDSPPSPTMAAPVTVNVLTDSNIKLNLHGFPGSNPVVVLFATSFAPGGALSINAVPTLNQYGFGIDIPDQGSPGYSDQEYVNGYLQPSPSSFTDFVGNLSLTINLPACAVVNGQPTCVTAPNWEVSAQALMVDPTNAPFGIRSTGAGVGLFTNGFHEYTIGTDGFATANFLGGFSFPFYGNVYTRAYISENGFVAFSSAGISGFPTLTIGDITSGPPRIMTFYEDLVQGTSGGVQARIYSQQFSVAGPGGTQVRKIKFVHWMLQEFANTTGPHGGETVITENGDIAILVAGYNSTPSINTFVGITRGSGGPAVGGFGRDLSMDVAFGPTTVPMGQHAFELFDHGTPGGAANGIDVVALGFFNNSNVGPGITFLLDPTTPNVTPSTTGYIIQ
ncbi:MAG TPA: hypothetical protein ENK43_00155 [Planctomycetes bacterium]|nr:hypothetical protein [Planctomycetota bacterium]